MARRIRIFRNAAIALTVAISGCGGGGGGGSSSSSTPISNAPIQGVATPSNVSVVTAQNDSAGG